MRKKILKAIFLIAFWMCLLPCAEAFQELQRPNWRGDQTWRVKVSYPNYMENGEWSSPIFWKYKVKGGASSDAYTIEIYPGDEETTPVTILYLGSEDLSPIRMESVKKRQGRIVRNEFDFEGIRPVITQSAMAPIDFPVFPLQTGATIRYSVTQTVAGDLKRKREIVVTCSVDRLPESYGDNSSKSSDYIKVTAAYDDGEVLFTQYWAEGKPWPSFGENGSMRYWLVEDEN